MFSANRSTKSLLDISTSICGGKRSSSPSFDTFPANCSHGDSLLVQGSQAADEHENKRVKVISFSSASNSNSLSRSSRTINSASPSRISQFNSKNTVQSPRSPAGLIRKSSNVACFNDPIHGNIYMDGLCLRIIDTKEFQRLRYLKQLGACDLVYTGATHTRFEHSIGVGYYAEYVAQNLKLNQPHLGITEEDILCVKVAGLCHDLGHGPFSHVFDGVFMKRMQPERNWRHEDGSVQMLRYLLSNNQIDISEYGLTARDQVFIEEIIYGVDERKRRGRPCHKFYLYDIVNNGRSGLDVDKLDYFQRDMKYTGTFSNVCSFDRFLSFGRVYAALPIAPENAKCYTPSPSENGEERGVEEAEEDEEEGDRHLMRIRRREGGSWGVNGGKSNGVPGGAGSAGGATGFEEHALGLSMDGDLDEEIIGSGRSLKITRHNLLIRQQELEQRQQQERQEEREGLLPEYPYMICYPEKLVREAVDLFAVRFRLHQNICKHKSVKKVDFMLIDALEKADPYVKIPGSVTPTHPDGLYRMSECVDDPHALSNLNDNIVYLIELSTDPNLAPAQEILSRMRQRKFYACLGKTMYHRGSLMDAQSSDSIVLALVEISRELTSPSSSSSSSFSSILVDGESSDSNTRCSNYRQQGAAGSKRARLAECAHTNSQEVIQRPLQQRNELAGERERKEKKNEGECEDVDGDFSTAPASSTRSLPAAGRGSENPENGTGNTVRPRVKSARFSDSSLSSGGEYRPLDRSPSHSFSARTDTFLESDGCNSSRHTSRSAISFRPIFDGTNVTGVEGAAGAPRGREAGMSRECLSKIYSQDDSDCDARWNNRTSSSTANIDIEDHQQQGALGGTFSCTHRATAVPPSGSVLHIDSMCVRDSADDNGAGALGWMRGGDFENGVRERGARSGNREDSSSAAARAGRDEESSEHLQLCAEDIIVEKVNIHYGMQQFNPVENMRFFPKDAPADYVAKPVMRQTYRTILPFSFEELALRVFCRTAGKERLLRAAYEELIRRYNDRLPASPSKVAAEGIFGYKKMMQSKSMEHLTLSTCSTPDQLH